MNLTEAGRTFHARCRGILSDLEEAETEASDRHGDLKGVLRVAAPLAFGNSHLPPIFIEFMRENPGVEMDIDMSDRITDLVAEGFDLAIRVGILRDAALVAHKLAEIRTVVCAAPRLITERGIPTHPDALKEWPALCHVGGERPELWRYTAPDGSAGAVQVTERMRVNNGRMICAAGVAGEGVLLQPSFVVQEAAERGELVPLLRDYRWPGIAIHVVYPQSRHLSARSRAFIDLVRRRIGPRPIWERFLEIPAA